MELPSLYTGIILMIIGSAGVLENAYVIYVYARSTNLRDTSMKVIVNLAITDFCTALAFGIDGAILISQVADNSLMTSNQACFSILMTMTYMIFVSQIVLMITTLDRYTAVCRYGEYTCFMGAKTVNILLVLAWVCPVPMILVTFLGFNNWDEIHICSYPNLLHQWVYKTFSSIIASLMATSAILYTNIMVKAWQFYRGFRPAQVQGINASSLRVRARQRAVKNGKAMAIITFAFITCWLPFHILQFQFDLKYDGSFSHVTWTFALGSLNCIINPFLYAWQKKEFRTKAKVYMNCCRRTTEDEQNEIVAKTSERGSNTATRSSELEMRQKERLHFQAPGETLRNHQNTVGNESNVQPLIPRVDI